MSNKQSSVEWLAIKLWERMIMKGDGAELNELLEQAKSMQKQQAQNYAEFCVMCDREKLPLLDFESFILTYGGNK